METTANKCARSINSDPTPANVRNWEQQAAMVMHDEVTDSSIRLVFKDTSSVYIDTPTTNPRVKTVEYDDGSIEPELLASSMQMFDKLFHAL